MCAAVVSDTGLELEEVTATRELDGLHQEWGELWARCPSATPFQSPDWLVPLWRHLGEGEVWIICLRLAGRLAAVAPFFILTSPESNIRRLLLLGTAITDYADLLVEPDLEDEGTLLVLSHLAAHQDRWDVLDFQRLPATSPLLNAPPLAEWTSQVTVQDVCPVLDLPEPARGLRGVVPAHMLEKASYHKRRLQGNGPLAFEQARLDNFPELFEAFLKLHSARWKRKAGEGGGGGVSDRRLQSFHRETAERMLLSGVLRLYGLRSGERIIASIYGFAHRRRTYYYLSGSDPEMAAFSPGTLMISYALGQAQAEGCAQFDFLRGREAYKYMWGAKGRLNYRRQFALAPAPAGNYPTVQSEVITHVG